MNALPAYHSTAFAAEGELTGIDGPAATHVLSPAREDELMACIYDRGDRLVARFIGLHALLALCLAMFYQTWLVTGVVTFCATSMFIVAARLLPRSFITRCIAGVSLQIFVALHIYQLHGLAEMHFFFFTAFTMLIVYQDWRCMWPGAIGIIGQHLGFALLHNAGLGAGLFFFDEGYVGFTKLFFHFGIALGQVALCGYWAYLLHRQTLASAVQNAGLREMSEQLHHSEARSSSLIEHALDIITILARDGTIRYESPAVARVLGYQPEELVGRNTFEFIHPEDRTTVAAAFVLRQGAGTSGSLSIEFRFRHRDGSWRWIEAVGSVMDESMGGIVVNSRDVTERRRAEREARRRASQQNATSELARQALAGKDLPGLLNAAVGLVARALEVEFCYVGERSQDGESLLVRAEFGYLPDANGPKVIPAGPHSQGGFTLLSNGPVVVEDLPTETRFQPMQLAHKQGVRSGLSVVIGGREQVFGVLVTQSAEPRRFTCDDIAFLSAVADIVSAAMARQGAEEALRLGEARYRALVRVSAQILWTTDAEGLVIDMPDWAAFTGQTTEQMRGYGWLDALHPDDRAHAAAAWRQAVSTRGIYATEYRIRRHDGGYEHFTAQGVPLLDADGHLRGWVGANANITARKHAEAAMRDAKEEAEKASLAKSEFLSRISHELRTPLNAILGFGQLLETSPLSVLETESVGHIMRAGRHLLGLIDEVLAISRIEAGHMNLSLEPVAVAGMLRECFGLVGWQAADRNVRFENICLQHGGCDHYVQADQQRLRQVLLNLLSNAVKYNREGGRVTVICREPASASRFGSDIPRLRLEVADTGHGLTVEQIGRLFTPFERLNAAHGATEGTGLGLALSKGLVEAMGGRIGVESVPGEGSTFWMELPLAANPLAALAGLGSQMGLAGSRDPDGGTVLYAEDNESNLRLIETLLLARPGLELLSAGSGAAALELARERRPDLILLDLHLPDLPGWEVLARLQADECTRGIPVIIISADATPGRIAQLLAAGASEYVTKPIHIGKLVQILGAHLHRRIALELPLAVE